MISIFRNNQRFERWIRSDYVPFYPSPPSPQTNALAHRRSRIAVQPLATQAEEVAL